MEIPGWLFLSVSFCQIVSMMETAPFSLHEISLPAEKLEDKTFREFFMEAMAGKIAAYKEMYGHNVLAFDRSDLFSRHFLVCRNSKAGPVPVSGFQVFESETSDTFGAVLPGLSSSRFSNAIMHEKYIETQLLKAKSEGLSVHWYGGFFKVPGALNRDELILNRALNSSMILGHLKQSKAISFSFVSMKANIYRYYNSLGFELCSFLPPEPISHPNYTSELKLIRFEEFKEGSFQEFEFNRQVWENRIHW